MIEVRLTRGLYAIVDDSDAYVIDIKWYAQRGYKDTFYAANKYQYGIMFMHRLIIGIENTSERVDHIDCNGLNNQKANLRIVTRNQNHYNRGMQCDNKSGYKGVSWDKICNKWRSQIAFDRKTYYIGNFDNAIDAALAYDEAAIEFHGEYANINFKTNK